MWINSRIFAVILSLILVMVDAVVPVAAQNNSPVRVWGDLSSTYRVRESGADDGSSTNWRNTGSINASSYIWRPWFALISGGVDLTLEESDASGQARTEERYISGNGQFDLFPTSRFPFQAFYRENRDEFDVEAFDQDIVTTKYGFSQRYSSRDGSGNYRAEYEHDEVDRDGQNLFVAESVQLGSINTFAGQSLETDIDLDTVDSTSIDEKAERQSITFDHSYGSPMNFSLDNLVSSARVERDFSDSSSDVETAQVSSFMNWRPRERGDLRISGGLRAAETRTVDQGVNIQPSGESEREVANANLNQGLLYSYSDNLRFSESISLDSIETDGEVESSESLSLGGRYISDPLESRFGYYNWSASSTYTNLSSDSGDETSLNNQFGHSLSNTYLLDSGYELRTNLTQSLNYDYKTEEEDEKGIDHSYSMTWTSATINRQNQIRLFISDSRELNEDNDFFHLVNLQYTGSSRLTRYTQLSGNATLQYTNQNAGGIPSEQLSTNGRLQYRRNRLFQNPGLTYYTQLVLSERRSETDNLIRDTGEDLQTSWENSLVYRVGRLEASADFDLFKAGNDYYYVLEFKLKRFFGDL